MIRYSKFILGMYVVLGFGGVPCARLRDGSNVLVCVYMYICIYVYVYIYICIL